MGPNDKFVLSKAHASRALDVLGRPSQYVMQLDCYGGSLGNGIGIGLGLLAGGSPKVYVLCGDGEMDEGSSQEALTYLYRNNISNLKVIVDDNGYGAYQKTNLFKFLPGCCDGHNIKQLIENINTHTITYATTIKGKGVSALENKIESHYHKFTEGTYADAKRELNA